MRKFHSALLFVITVGSAACGGEPRHAAGGASTGAGAPGSGPAGQVMVNDEAVSANTLTHLRENYRVSFRDGRYWYDARSGLIGAEGQPPLGLFVAGLELGGTLRADASLGDTGVFINGRQLHRVEVEFLSRYMTVYPGRFWLDASGYVGVEGEDAPLINLFEIVRSASQRGGTNYGGGHGSSNDNYYGNISSGTYANSENGCSYVSVGGSTVTSGCG